MGGDPLHEDRTMNPYGFNPRLRMGGDNGVWSFNRQRRVSIHASAWEATWLTTSTRYTYRSFNPRLRMGGDKQETLRWRIRLTFQSTPPHGRRPLRSRAARMTCRFNPRLRMGGDLHTPDLPHLRKVSIHASAWEATGFERVDGFEYWFQSTPPHGRRLQSVSIS